MYDERKAKRIPVILFTDMKLPNNFTQCIQCGTCCLKGGPVLHHEDREILCSRHIGYQHLVTIRKGELVLNPHREKLETTRKELIKVIGKGKEWSCCFYDRENSSCKIYEHRFLECRLLKCWDTSDLISVIGKNTINRFDVINPDDPIRRVIETHEKECPYNEVENLILTLSKGSDKSAPLAKLTELVRKDMAIRFYAFSELGLKAEFEFFIFGRPLSNLLGDRGITVHVKTSKSNDLNNLEK
jgi:Fe-S-cluster containining protein